MLNYNKIESLAFELLEQNSLSSIVPIPLMKLLSKLGIKLEKRNLGEEISGLLVIKPNSVTIGLNDSQGQQRKNFTIAHEIGHYVLHRGEKHMFVDETIGVFARSNESNNIEREANAFAAALLMPKVLIEKKMKELSVDDFSISDNDIKNLSDKFKVSQIAMTYRLNNLGIINLK